MILTFVKGLLFKTLFSRLSVPLFVRIHKNMYYYFEILYISLFDHLDVTLELFMCLHESVKLRKDIMYLISPSF